MQNILICQILFLCQLNFSFYIDCWVYTFDSSTFWSSSSTQLLNSCSILTLHPPLLFIYTSLTNSRLHTLLPRQLLSIKCSVSFLRNNLTLFNYSWLKHRYLHSLFNHVFLWTTYCVKIVICCMLQLELMGLSLGCFALIIVNYRFRVLFQITVITLKYYF